MNGLPGNITLNLSFRKSIESICFQNLPLRPDFAHKWSIDPNLFEIIDRTGLDEINKAIDDRFSMFVASSKVLWNQIQLMNLSFPLHKL